MPKHIAPAMEFDFVPATFNLEVVDGRESAEDRGLREARQAAQDRAEAGKNQADLWVCDHAADETTRHFYCGRNGFSGRHLCCCGGTYHQLGRAS